MVSQLTRSHNDTSYRATFQSNPNELFTYTDTQFPELYGTTMNGRDMNYIGVGEGFAANGVDLGSAIDLSTLRYNLAHPGDDPSNAIQALQAGYSAYINKISPCPDASGTNDNSVAPPYP